MKIKGLDGKQYNLPDDSSEEEIMGFFEERFPKQMSELKKPGGSVKGIAVVDDSPIPKGSSDDFWKNSVMGSGIKEGPQTAGSVAYGLAGAAGGLSAAPGLAMVALGGAAGESLKQMGQHLSGSPDRPRSSTESAKRMAKAGVTEAGYDMIGGFLTKGVSKIVAPFKSTLKEGAADVMQMFNEKIKPVLLPSEATNSRILDILHNISEASLIGGNKLAEYKVKRAKFFNDYADSLIDQFGNRTSPDELGELFVTAIEGKKEVHKKASDVLYNNVEDMVKTRKVKETVYEDVTSNILGKDGKPITRKIGKVVDREVSPVMVSTNGMKSFLRTHRKIVEEIGSIEGKNAGDDLAAAISALPPKVSFAAARDLRSRLISRVDEFSVINRKAPSIGKAKRLISLLDGSIETGIRKADMGPGGPSNDSVLQAWRTANEFYRGGQDQFNNTFLRRMVKMADDSGTGAENIAPAIFKPGQVSRVMKVKKALGPQSQEWRKMQGFFVHYVMQKAANENGDIVGKKLLNVLSGKPSSMGDKMMAEVLAPDQIRSLKLFGNAVKMSQEKQADGAGRMLIQLSQAGALAAVGTGNLKLPAAAILLTPAIMTRMMLNPTMSRILTIGLNTPAGSREAAGIMARIAAAAVRVKEDMDDEDTTEK